MSNIVTIQNKSVALQEEYRGFVNIIPANVISFWVENKDKLQTGYDSLLSVGAVSVFLSHFTPLEQLLSTGIDNVLKYSSVAKINEILNHKIKQIENGLIDETEISEIATQVMEMDAFLKASIQNSILSFALVYLGLSTDSYDNTSKAILLNYIKTQINNEYKNFSLHEIELAFQSAAKNKDVKYFGVINASIFNAIMSAYKAKRGKFIDDIEQGLEKKNLIEAVIPLKVIDAYDKCIKKYHALILCNTVYKHFSQIPLGYLKKMYDDGVFMLDNKKVEEIRYYCATYTFYAMYRACRKNIDAIKNFRSFVFEKWQIFLGSLWEEKDKIPNNEELNILLDSRLQELKYLSKSTFPDMSYLHLTPRNDFNQVYKTVRVNNFLKMCYFSTIAAYSGTK